MTPAKLRKVWNNSELKLGYFPKSSYSENTNTNKFTELTYNGKPLLVKIPKFNKKVYSILFENGEFTNACNISLFNETLHEAISATESREITWFSAMEQQGFIWGDYVWRLYFATGSTFESVYTGVIEDVSFSNDAVLMNLNSRAAFLKKITGNETKTTLAGWNVNARFGTCLDSILKDTDVEVAGDIIDIDYQQTENEGDADLKSSLSQHTSYYAENTVALTTENKEYDYKYDTYSNLFADNVVFHFIGNDDEHYYVLKDDSKRVGQFTWLELVKGSGEQVADLGMGRAPEVSLENTGDIKTYFQAKVAVFYDGDINGNFDDLIGARYCETSHQYTNEAFSGGDKFAPMGEIVEQSGYYIPLMSDKYTWDTDQVVPGGNYSQYYWDTDENRVMYRNGAEESPQYNSEGTFVNGEMNGLSGDAFFKSEDSDLKDFSSGDTDYNLRKDKSIKSRSYFLYDSINDRLVFQRPSNAAPVVGDYENVGAGAYNIEDGTPYADCDNGDYIKTWSNFGLNPIGYYSLSQDNLGYLNLQNDLFIEDWIYKNNTIYAIGHSFLNNAKRANSKRSKVLQFTLTGAITEIGFFDSKEHYGLNWFEYEGDEYLSMIRRNNSDVYKWSYYKNGSYDFVELGSINNFTAPTSVELIDGDPVLMTFKNQKLTYYKPFDQANNVTYLGETLEKSLGGYIIKNEDDDNFTAKIENNVITYVSQQRIEVLDLTDYNKLQALLLLANRADKYMYVDNNDILQFKDAVSYQTTTLQEFISFVKIPYEGFKTLLIKTYDTKPEDRFSWSYKATEDYIGRVLGTWSGADASFTINLAVTGLNQITYHVTSSSSRLRLTEQVDAVANWDNIVIPIDDFEVTLRFLDEYEATANAPKERTKFTLSFQTKKLVELSSPLTETDTTNGLSKTKTIDNRLVDPSSALFLQEEVNDFFLANRNSYKIEVLEPYSQFDMLQTIYINYPRENIKFVECYIVSMRINEKGTTEMILIEK